MSVDFFDCENCADSICDCDSYFRCPCCDRKLCEACEKEFKCGMYFEDWPEDYEDLNDDFPLGCPYCTQQIFDDSDLLEIALAKLGVSREVFIQEIQKRGE